MENEEKTIRKTSTQVRAELMERATEVAAQEREAERQVHRALTEKLREARLARDEADAAEAASAAAAKPKPRKRSVPSAS